MTTAPFDVVSVGVHAEAAGFDSLWVNHHVINAGYVRERLGSRPYHDALVLLTWLASKTHSARIGTSVLVLPYLHPMVLARELAQAEPAAEAALRWALHRAGKAWPGLVLATVPTALGRATRDRLRSLMRQDAAGILEPRPLCDGHQLARLAGLQKGPELGRLVGAMRKAQVTLEVTDAEAARAFARRWPQRGGEGQNPTSGSSAAD